MTARGDDGATPRLTGTVLYIEDNEANIRLVKRIFERQGDVVVVEAMLGELGLELARDRPDLILLDLNLPDISGGDVLARLRADPVTSDIPVIVMTADSTAATSGRLIALGVTAFVTKPISIGTFLEVVAMVLAPAPPQQPADS